MENGDAPLTTSWAPSAFALFKEELLELEELTNAEEKVLETDLAQLKAQTTVEATRLLLENPMSSKPFGTTQQTGTTGASSLPASGTTRRAQKHNKDKNTDASNATASARRENMIEARTNQLVAQYERQPWRRLYQHYQSELAAVRSAVEPVCARESREADFFLSRAPENYSLDDVLDAGRHRYPLCTATDSVSASHGGNHTNDTSMTGHLPAPAAASSSQEPCRPSTAPTSALVQDLSVDVSHCIIDAVAFAHQYNETLTATYGYKPVLGTDLPGPSASHSAWAEDSQKLRAEMDSHRPGLDTVPSEFCIKTFPPAGHAAASAPAQGTHSSGAAAAASSSARPRSPLPPAVGAAGSRRGRRADGGPSNDCAVDESGSLSLRSLRLPTLTGLARGHARGEAGTEVNTPATTVSSGLPTHPGGATSLRRGQRSAQATAPAATRGASGDEAARTVRDRLARAPKMECSAKNDTVTLRTVAGQEVRETIRFTNRAPHQMRFKVKPSNHAWLSFTCTDIAPVPGAGRHHTATRDVPVETPLSTGGYIDVEVVFDPLNTSEPDLTCMLEIGTVREVNAQSGEGAQWQFYPVTVHCEVVLPAFKLYKCLSSSPPSPSESADGGARQEVTPRRTGTVVTRCDFPYTFALASSTLHFQLENTGSTAYVTFVCDSEEFFAEPSHATTSLLPHGDVLDLAVSFAPLCQAQCRSHLVVEVRETEVGPVLARHSFELRGEGVVPHVHLHQLDDAVVDTSGHPQWQLNPEEGPARVTLENTTPDVPKTIRVVVTNESPVALPFEWACEANNGTSTGDASAAYATDLAIVPASGSLAPNAETVFEATVTAHSVFPILSSWCLYLKGLPVVQADARSPHSRQHHGSAPQEVLAFYERPKLVPSARLEAVDDGQTGANATTVVPVDAYSDPVGVFKPRLIPQPAGHADKVFATGFFLVAYPVVPSAVLVPSCLEESVDCLLHYENVRRITLKNHSPRLLHYILDPTAEECQGLCAPSPWRFSTRGTEEPDVQVSFTPRTGAVPPFGSATITVRFAVHTVGPHHLEMSCFIPEIMAYSHQRSPLGRARADSTSVATPQVMGLVEMSTDGAGSGPAAALTPCSHTVALHVTGVGASVHASTEFLDFGLIEEGHEAEASFTVTNDNPIPITFDLQDPLLREPPRFVFIPPMFRLGAGDSVEVTVYRKGVAAGDAQTFFELCVRDGATIAIETRATIQSATLMLEDAVLQYGTVPDNVWQEQVLHVTNTSALDAPFTIEMAFPLPTPHIDVEFASQHVVRAGQSRYAVPVRARFRHRAEPSPEEREAGMDRYRTLLAVRSLRTNRALLVEVRCEVVEQLAVSLDVTLPSEPGRKALALPVESYIHALLCNEVVDGALRVVEGGDDGTADAEPRALQPYCPPVELTTTLPSSAPISRESFVLCITNHTGCNSDYHVQAQCFAPLPVESAKVVARGALPRTTNTQEMSKPPPKSSGTGTTTTATPSAVPMMTITKASFWTTAVNGVEQREQAKRMGLSTAQQLLRDGRGCATTLDGSAATAVDGALGPHAALQLPFVLLANLPGRYAETLRVSCGALAPVDIPVSYKVQGCPVLIDPTTSGLTRVDGLDVLVMPSVIASVATSRRGIKVMNRVPRDLDVSVEAFITASTFEVIAIEDDMAASQVVLKLAPLSERTQRREQECKGRTYVTPSHFFLPAMSSKEVIVEYTPSLALVQGVLATLDGLTDTQAGTRKRGVATTTTTAPTQATGNTSGMGQSAPSSSSVGLAPPNSILTSSTGAPRAGRSADKSAPRERTSARAGPRSATDPLRTAATASQHGSSGTDSETSDDDDDRVRPAATQEVDWHGSLVIQATIAESAFNDAFLIDEFYFLNADKYPSTRRLRSDQRAKKGSRSHSHTRSNASQGGVGLAGGEGLSGNDEGDDCPGWATSVVRSVPMLDVQRPLRSRPGRVVKQNRILAPTQAESFLLDRELQRLGLASSCGSPSGADASRTSGTQSASTGHRAHTDTETDSSGEDDEDQAVANVPLLDAAAGEMRPVAVLLAEHEERLALEAYLCTRRTEVRLESGQFFLPLELRLRARCGVPRLAVQPSASGVFFPPYTPNVPCLRTMRLTNRNSASLFFQLSVSVPEYFRVVEATLVPSGVEEDPLVEEDEESKLGIRAARALKWSNTADRKRAGKMLKSGQQGDGTSGVTAQRSAIVSLSPQAQSNMLQNTETLSPLMTALKAAASSGPGEHGSGVPNPVYCLRSNDALDVTVEVVNAHQFARRAESRHAVLRSTANAGMGCGAGGTGTVGLASSTPGAATASRLTTQAGAATSHSPVTTLPPISLDAIVSIHFLQTSVPRPPAALTPAATAASSHGRHAQTGSTHTTTTATGAPLLANAMPSSLSAGAAASSRPSSKRGVRTLDITGHDYVEQTVPLCMHFTAVVVSSSPSLVWFKPGQTRHDGRPQPAYPQRLTLFNHTKQPVTYQLVAVSAQQSFATSSRHATIGTASELTTGRKLHEVTNLPDALINADGSGAVLVDDASAFVVTPLRGVIPASTRGGEPGVTTLHASFVEHSNVRYECAYRVLINGALSECSFLLRGDSRESEV